jgi:hypothetical protein
MTTHGALNKFQKYAVIMMSFTFQKYFKKNTPPPKKKKRNVADMPS